MRIFLGLLAIIFTLIFTKWQHWKEYYATILFMITLNLALSLIIYNHRFWIFGPSAFLSTHTMSNLFHSFITFPCTVLLYLSHYPHQKVQQIFFILAWAFLYSFAEFLFGIFELVMYANGWSLTWSAAFNLIMFPILRVHYSNPLLAWGLSLALLMFIWIHFGLSITMIK